MTSPTRSRRLGCGASLISVITSPLRLLWICTPVSSAMAKRSASRAIPSETSFGSVKGPETCGSAATCPTLLGFCHTHCPTWHASPFQHGLVHTGDTEELRDDARGGEKRSGAR